MPHVEVEARHSAYQKSVESDHQIADEKDAAHELGEELSALVQATVVVLAVVDLIAVDEPAYQQSIHQDQSGYLVLVAKVVEVLNHKDLQQLE